MLARTLLDLHGSLQRQDVLFAYHGMLSNALLTSLGTVVKAMLQQDGVESKRARNLFAVFVEQGQNILRYSIQKRDDNGETPMALGILMIGREGDRYVVAAGNAIPAAAVERLNTRLTELARLDSDALKQAYKDRLRQPAEATSKGAGVGFMEMARRSSDGVQFDFLEIDAETAYFAVRVSL